MIRGLGQEKGVCSRGGWFGIVEVGDFFCWGVLGGLFLGMK